MTDATRNAPISSHPAFKWGVGVWFALLLGFGLFVMPATIHQLLAERLGIDGVLAGTAIQRIVLSGSAALLGLLIGLVLAMRVAAINDVVSDDDADTGEDLWLPEEDETYPFPTAEDSPRRPFNPREDLGEEGIAIAETDVDNGVDETLSEPIEAHDTVFEEIEADGVAALSEDGQDEPTGQSPAGFPEKRDTLRIEPFEKSGRDPLVIAGETEDEIFTGVQEETPVELEAADSRSPVPVEALGDMSLDALTARLGAALETFKAGPVVSQDTDPVIAFLRREADRGTQQQDRDSGANDPQTELRNALDKLNRVGKPK